MRTKHGCPRLAACLVVFACLFLFPCVQALAQTCTKGNISGLGVSSLDAGNYDAAVVPVPHFVTITVATTRSCALQGAFIRSGLPPVMTRAGNTLGYVIEPVGGGASYVVATSPSPNPIDLDVKGGGGTLTTQVQLTIAAGQSVPVGLYTDTALTFVLFTKSGPNWVAITSLSVTPQATVVGSCTLGAPSPATVAFSSNEIPYGVPDPGIVKNATLTATCSAPTRVRLTGGALVQSPTVAAGAGLDGHINYRAVAAFGAATATLITTSPSPAIADSPTRNVASGAASGIVSVDVNLLAGQPLVSGTYTGVLTVTLDPAL